MKKFFAVFMARNMEYFRDRGALLWNFMFPIIIVFGLAFAFSGENQSVYKVGLLSEAPAAETGFFSYDYIQYIEYETETPALDKLRHHQIDMVVDPESKRYWVNESAPNGYFVEKLLLGIGPDGSTASNSLYTRGTVSGRPIRYVDWVVPGVIGMNVMFSCLSGVGFIIVRYRKNGVLKRLKATPLSAFEFISAQVISRYFIVLLVSAIVFFGSNFFLHFIVEGSMLLVLALFTLTVICLITLGLVFATRLKSEELAWGLVNIVSWPMMIMSGVWFSLEGSPKILQQIAQAFPLTHFTEASRAIMLDGAGFAQVADHFIVLGIMTAVFLLISSILFKWE